MNSHTSSGNVPLSITGSQGTVCFTPGPVVCSEYRPLRTGFVAIARLLPPLSTQCKVSPVSKPALWIQFTNNIWGNITKTTTTSH